MYVTICPSGKLTEPGLTRSPTDSELQIALVALFSEMLYRFPNVVVAHVTRESVQQAIANGITAQQVLCYCTQWRIVPLILYFFTSLA